MPVFSAKSNASKGIALGEVFLAKKRSRKAAYRLIGEGEKEAETNRLFAAFSRVSDEIKKQGEKNDIFAAHHEIIEDPALQETALMKITGENKNAEQALVEAEDELCDLFADVNDEYLKERVSDIRDVCSRIYNRLQGISDNPFSGIDHDVIVVADDLLPSDTMMMDFSKVRGLITRFGGATSHVSIIARDKGIPAVVGLGDTFPLFSPGDFVILDALDNQIFINPAEELIGGYCEKAELYHQQKEKWWQTENAEVKTSDGHNIDLLANAGSPNDVQLAINRGASGIGLFRSEFLFLQSSDSFPDEETQFSAYRNAAETCKGKNIIIRTLDIGGDKSLPYFPFEKEDNPFLGWRAIRISLSRKDLFRTQLRALLRASASGNLRIMFPMIVSVEEYREAVDLLEKCKNELRAEGVLFDENIVTGVMIETPAAVMMAEELAKEAGFFSVGTNDLTQYILAADRLNPRIEYLYDSFHPAVLRSIRQVITAAHRHGKTVGLCGEMAANPRATELLIGLGFDSLSITPGIFPEIRKTISDSVYERAVKLATEACRKSTVNQVNILLEEVRLKQKTK